MSEKLLRAVLLDLRRKDMPDGPCWCSVEPNATNRFTHERKCRDARAALATPDRADVPEDCMSSESHHQWMSGMRECGCTTPDRADLC